MIAQESLLRLASRVSKGIAILLIGVVVVGSWPNGHTRALMDGDRSSPGLSSNILGVFKWQCGRVKIDLVTTPMLPPRSTTKRVTVVRKGNGTASITKKSCSSSTARPLPVRGSTGGIRWAQRAVLVSVWAMAADYFWACWLAMAKSRCWTKLSPSSQGRLGGSCGSEASRHKRQDEG